MRTPLLAAAALLALLGCNQAPQDSGKVLFNVAGQKFTESEFTDLVKAIEPARAQDILTNPKAEAQAARVGFVSGLAQDRAILAYAKQTGADQGAIYKMLLVQAQSQAAMKAMISQRIGEPSEADLAKVYEGFKARNAQGAAGFPSYADVLANPALKGQLVNAWKQERSQAAVQDLMKEIRAQVPVTFAEGYQPIAE
ncbi:MAG TPA: hypothetical protein VJ623_09505 [Holophagaceae bacterium]|nr:hypothetical protein [Holophagaceae bacterium]HJW32252.1 hypothetical protein [Holophagaceae bacterium]